MGLEYCQTYTVQISNEGKNGNALRQYDLTGPATLKPLRSIKHSLYLGGEENKKSLRN